MGRGLGFQQQQQCYGDNGMWMDTHAQQQQGYGFHEESWGSDNMNYNKQQFPSGMHMKIKPGGANYAMVSHGNINKLGGNHGMFHETMHNNYGHHGYCNNYGHGGGINKLGGGSKPSSHHQFSNVGVNKFTYGGHHGGYNFEEHEEYSEEHHGAGKVKVDQMRYERHNYGGGDHGFHANPYGQNMNMNWKPHGYGGHKAEWIAKGDQSYIRSNICDY